MKDEAMTKPIEDKDLFELAEQVERMKTVIERLNNPQASKLLAELTDMFVGEEMSLGRYVSLVAAGLQWQGWSSEEFQQPVIMMAIQECHSKRRPIAMVISGLLAKYGDREG